MDVEAGLESDVEARLESDVEAGSPTVAAGGGVSTVAPGLSPEGLVTIQDVSKDWDAFCLLTTPANKVKPSILQLCRA